MPGNIKKELNKLTLAIHSTDDSFGFGCRKDKNYLSDKFFVKKFENDLCNNLIVDFAEFISKENVKKIDKISVSIGPANFNSSRLIVVLARTLSHQINCSLDSFSSFELMAKRIALKNNIFTNKQSFWIFKKLKKKGYIAGKYEVSFSEKFKNNLIIKEKVIPKLFKNLSPNEPTYQVEYSDLEDLKELLNLSNNNLKSLNLNAWENVLPLYPIYPIN